MPPAGQRRLARVLTRWFRPVERGQRPKETREEVVVLKTTKQGKPKREELPEPLKRSPEKAQRTYAKMHDSAVETPTARASKPIERRTRRSNTPTKRSVAGGFLKTEGSLGSAGQGSKGARALGLERGHAHIRRRRRGGEQQAGALRAGQGPARSGALDDVEGRARRGDLAPAVVVTTEGTGLGVGYGRGMTDFGSSQTPTGYELPGV
jgi:hypothetical protein